MRKLFITLLLAIVAIFTANAQLLYKISDGGLDKPSYIIGTYHLAPASFVDSIPGARAALDEVEQVCGELDMREVETAEGKKKLMAAMQLPDGMTIDKVLLPEEMDKLNAYMKQIMGTDLSNPLLRIQMGRMNPMAISTQLQLLQFMKLTPGFNPLALIDSYFQNEAEKKDKPVVGFETVDFQIKVLYGTPLERQKEQLFCMIDNHEYSLELMKSIAAAYFSQDIDAILAAAEEKMGNACDSSAEEDNALIYDRNNDWVGKIPSIAATRSTLFVVGAAHLPGERGVLELLRKGGYTVEAVR